MEEMGGAWARVVLCVRACVGVRSCLLVSVGSHMQADTVHRRRGAREATESDGGLIRVCQLCVRSSACAVVAASTLESSSLRVRTSSCPAMSSQQSHWRAAKLIYSLIFCEPVASYRCSHMPSAPNHILGLLPTLSLPHFTSGPFYASRHTRSGSLRTCDGARCVGAARA